MIFFHDNYLSLSENSRVTYFGNRATDTGGAMYIVTSPFHYTRHDFILDNRMCLESCFLNFFGQKQLSKAVNIYQQLCRSGWRCCVWRKNGIFLCHS